MPPVRFVALMCLAHVGVVMGVFVFPSLLPHFQEAWKLSHAEAGWINGIYFAGYTLSVAWLSALADRVDAKYLFLGGAVVLALSNACFALLAQGFWTAMLFQGLAGIGLAAAYMPGLKALLDRLPARYMSRASAFYTASFSLGSATGYAVSGWAGAAFGWQAAFAIASAGALAAALFAFFLLAPKKPEPPPPGRLLDFRPVLRNRKAMAYILAYGAHCWELFGQRGWLVAFLTYAALQTPDGIGLLPKPTSMASLCALVAMVSSITGNELASRFGRKRLVLAVLLASGLAACLIGFTAEFGYGLVIAFALLHSILIQGDSAALTAGAVHAAETGRRGATMALHSLIGFGSAFLGPVAMGLAIDLGGGSSALGFGLGFAVLGLGTIPGGVALYLLSRV